MLNFIFDLDDTLIATREIFVRAEQTFSDEMERLGFDRNIAAHTLVEIDTENIERLGFKPTRFPSSIGETYEALCKSRKSSPDPGTRRRLEDIGRRVFTITPRVLDGAAEVLEMLTQNGDQLLLWTRGDQEVQRRNLFSSGLAHYFGKVYVFERNKTAKELTDIIRSNKLSPSATWVIGDSIRSDINPALEVGAHAIWIPGTPWQYDNIAPMHGDFVKLSSMIDFLELYPRLSLKT